MNKKKAIRGKRRNWCRYSVAQAYDKRIKEQRYGRWGGRKIAGGECRGRGRRGLGVGYRVRRQGGGNSAGTAGDCGNKKTNNALRDKTCPGVDVARCCGKDSAVEQGPPGKAERARPRAKAPLVVGDPGRTSSN